MEKQMFMEIFNYLKKTYRNLSISDTPYGAIVCWNGEERFNIEGYNLAYNLYQLTKLLKREGEFE